MPWHTNTDPFLGIGFNTTRHGENDNKNNNDDPRVVSSEDSLLAGQPRTTMPTFVSAHTVDPAYPYYQSKSPIEPFPPPPPPPPPPLPIHLQPPLPPSISSIATSTNANITSYPHPTHMSQSLSNAPNWMTTKVGTSTELQPSQPMPSTDMAIHPRTSPSGQSSRPFQSTHSQYGTLARQRQVFSMQQSSTSTSLQLQSTVQPTVDLLSQEVQQGRDKAMKVIQQFQNNNNAFYVDTEIAQKRKASLELLEQRKRLAMIKNLEYVAKAEDERLKAKLLQVHQTQDYQTMLEAHHQQSLEIRSQHLGKGKGTSTPSNVLLSGQAGIGTQQRQRFEDKRRKNQLPASSDTVAIYVSNLPTADGSASEELLRALFGCLGYSLRKIHFYIHKETGKLKGDALIVYELPSGEDRNTLTETVCSQMNGAELPCGTSIKVEASDPLHKLRKKKESDHHYGPVDALDTPVQTSQKNEEDLDDFFASLDDDEQSGAR